MATTWFGLGTNSASESWRIIRSVRSERPPAIAMQLCGERAQVFQAALEQSQQQFEAAGRIAYESRPLNLYYGISQAGRAIAAASSVFNARDQDPTRRLWKASGHGLKIPTDVDKSQGIFSSVLNVDPGDRDLFSRASIALGSPTNVGHIALGAVVSQIPEYAYQFGPLRDEAGPLDDGGIGVSGPAADETQEYLDWEIDLRDSPDRGRRTPASVRSTLDRYPALRSAEAVVDDRGQLRSPHDAARTLIRIPRTQLVPDDVGWWLLPREAAVYRRRKFMFPVAGASEQSLAPLMGWWLVLYGLSMVARYSPGDWTATLAMGVSPVASKVEHLLDVALDAVPDLIAESLLSL